MNEELGPIQEEGMKRLFIALHPPREINEEIGGILLRLSGLNRGVKWASEDGQHLTLNFLGWVEEDKISPIKEVLRQTFADSGPVEFEFGEIGALPELRRPRVVYLECKQVAGQSIAQRQNILTRELLSLGIEQEQRPWLPHLTLGRVKRAQQLNLVKNNLKGRRFSIGSVELMESTLTPSGSIYREVASFKL